jgi:hypothetical protein
MDEGTRRRRPGLTLGALLVLVGLGGGTLVVLSILRLGPGFGGPLATSEPALPDADACPIPADAAARVVLAESSGGGSDPNGGGGAAILCRRDGEPIAASTALTCVWSADRSHVRRVSIAFGNDPDDPLILELHSEALRPIELTLFSEGAVYRSSDPTRVGGAVSGAPDGVLGFREVPAHLDAAATPNPGTADGIFRWACADPPEPVVGETAGTVQLLVDGFAPVRQGDATCRWVKVDGAPVLFSIDTYADAFVFGNNEAGVSIARGSLGPDDMPGIYLWISDPARGGLTFTGTFLWPLARSPDMGSASLRFRGFAVDAGVASADLPNLTSGNVSWTCAKPSEELPPAPEGHEPAEVLATRSGTGIIRLGNPLDEELPATVTCWVRDPRPETDPETDPVVPQIERIQMEARYGDERLILTTIDYQLVLERLGPDGRILGEYVPIDGGAWYAQDADVGPHRVGMGRLAFEPTSGPNLPLGGPGGPENFELMVTVDCRLF